MTDFNHWDFASTFTAVQAALLIEGKNPDGAGSGGRDGAAGIGVSKVILKRMKSGYDATVANYQMYIFAFDEPGFGKKYPRRALDSKLSILPSADMLFHAAGYRDGFDIGFEDWLTSDKSSFESQVFQRKDIQNWIDANKFSTMYQFEGVASPVAGSNQKVDRWPWGDHHTELLGHLDAAARRYWGAGYDSSDTSTASTNAVVSEWLQKERKVSRTMADSIATMLRPNGLPTGPRK